jgi:hypothetical protein
LESRFAAFKFLADAHADDFLHHGKVRIGTLEDFRNLDRHTPGISDEMDASSGFVLASGTSKTLGELTANGLTVQQRLRGGLVEIDCFESRFENVRTIRRTQDLFVFCASRFCRPEDISMWRALGKTRCVQILDMKAACSASAVKYWNWRKFEMNLVRYENVMASPDEADRDPNPFVKDIGLKDQAEVRIVWEPLVRPIKPFVGFFPQIVPLLREVPMPSTQLSAV